MARLANDEDGFFDATANLKEVEGYVQRFDRHNSRNLQSLDLFAGEGTFYNVSKDAGLNSRKVDKLHDPINENLLTKAGFFATLALVCSLEPSLQS